MKHVVYMSLAVYILEYGAADISVRPCAKESSYICKSYERFGVGNLGAM
jgi:hypothetical protein